MDTTIYNEQFHQNRDSLTRHTAETVSKIILKNFAIQKVCDVGGGLGTWLDVFREKIGKDKFSGMLLDGDYINKKDLIVPELFKSCDLENHFEFSERFDLTVCLEVAEHVSEKRAEGLIADLCALSDIVLFSAAIPLQGGEGHINENTFSYWRNLFCKNGYSCYDMVRPYIQNDGDIPWWYRNNIFVYVSDRLPKNEAMRNTNNAFCDFISMETYMSRVNEIKELTKPCVSEEPQRGFVYRIARKIKRCLWKK